MTVGTRKRGRRHKKNNGNDQKNLAALEQLPYAVNPESSENGPAKPENDGESQTNVAEMQRQLHHAQAHYVEETTVITRKEIHAIQLHAMAVEGEAISHQGAGGANGEATAGANVEVHAVHGSKHSAHSELSETVAVGTQIAAQVNQGTGGANGEAIAGANAEVHAIHNSVHSAHSKHSESIAVGTQFAAQVNVQESSKHKSKNKKNGGGGNGHDIESHESEINMKRKSANSSVVANVLKTCRAEKRQESKAPENENEAPNIQSSHPQQSEEGTKNLSVPDSAGPADATESFVSIQSSPLYI